MSVWSTVEASVNTDVTPVFATDETTTGDPLTVTVNALGAGTATANVSSNVNVKSVPFAAMAPLTNCGGVVSETCELLVTGRSVKSTTRFPAAS